MRLGTLLAVILLVALGSSGQPGFQIDTDSELPSVTVYEARSLTLTASGGISPYNWTLASGALPPGLTLAASGLLSGTPTQPGPFYFVATVTDSSGAFASKAFGLIVIQPPTPVVSITGLQDTESPGEQPAIDVQLSSAYPREITGLVTLTFESDAVHFSDDPSIQFSTGGRTLNFTIPAGQTSASWESPPAIQTGTIAGRIKLRLQYSAGGQNLTPTFAPFRLVTIARAVPRIDAVQAVRTTGGLSVKVSGYSTPREVTSATFTFTALQGGASLEASVTVSVDTAFTGWYTAESATQFGSAFEYVQPFTVQGSTTDIASVLVTLSNSAGSSSSVSANF